MTLQYAYRTHGKMGTSVFFCLFVVVCEIANAQNIVSQNIVSCLKRYLNTRNRFCHSRKIGMLLMCHRYQEISTRLTQFTIATFQNRYTQRK